jgi:uncharacterized protein (TIGR00290 family)
MRPCCMDFFMFINRNAKMKEDKRIPVSLSWSGGKDSAYALWKLNQGSEFQVKRLHTTFDSETRRVSMHGIHEDLIQLQADALGLPLDKIFFKASEDVSAYTEAVENYLIELQEQGINHLAYGDIFLEDLKKFRQQMLSARGMEAVFPLWGMPTAQLARDFIREGFVTLVCAADENLVASAWVGKFYDNSFLEALPDGVDPCGENGEFHTFFVSGPMLKETLPVRLGKLTSQVYHYHLEDGTPVKKKFWFREIKVI